jgi:CubicO group peptidase (beta-lactamase class C family)/D-alanyl-D-alanine dipeptidase
MPRLRSFLAFLLLAAPSLAQTPPEYAPVVKQLTALIDQQVKDKNLPALSIALVDDQKLVWSAGFGFRDAKKTQSATADTVYRVGSVSKLFTDVAIMRLVEQGKIDLDAPVNKYLPNFAPKNPFDKTEVTLRHLMAHRSGLIRESPVGNYFDPTGPTLEKTVGSVNGLDLVYPPGKRIKYSNAAIATVGFVLEKTQGERFETYLKKDVLDRLGMSASAFEATPAVKKQLAEAVMWSQHGREFPAPTFELGMAPAGSMYSTVGDLGKFMSCLFADGKGVLKSETVAAMCTPQFADAGAKSGFGIGFMVGDLDGRKRIGHGGAVYGFATELALLPKEKLGVIVTCSRDVANTVVTRIADDALRMMLAARDGKPLPKVEETTAIPPAEAKELVGRYRGGDRWLDITESAGKVYVTPSRGGHRFQIKKVDGGYTGDDVEAWGPRFTRDGNKLTVGGRTYTREKPGTTPPPEPPVKWKGLIGEYGWDHNTLFVYEKDGQLHALIEWTEIDPLTEESESVFAFPPDRGMYHGEKLIFTRDKDGRATKVVAANVTFERRKIDGEGGETFRIKPQRPLDELRKEALAATPPAEKGEFRKSELVDLATIDPGIKFDIRYATDNNFLSTPFYTSAKAYMQKPAAEALGRVHKKLAEQGYGLLVFDAYRPWHVTKMFWDATPDKFHGFVADPSKGSRHNRGCAVDLGLYDLKTGKPVEVVSGFDEFSDRAYPDYPGGTSRQRWHRDLLRRAMEADGFTVYEAEWWHFDFQDWKQYPIGNAAFEKLK